MAGLDAAKQQIIAELKKRGVAEDVINAKLGITPPPTEIVEEMHPDIGTFERMAAQNLGTGPEAMAQYLQSKHGKDSESPLEVKVMGGRVVARKPNEDKYRVLDPSLDMPSSGSVLQDLATGAKEAGMDLTDVGADVVSGVGSTLAGAAGGVAGFAAGGPPGAVAGAMGAGGAAGAGLETARQGIGKAFGVNKEFDLPQIGIAGGAGAIAPVLFGAGSIEQQLLQAAAKRDLTGKAADEFVQAGLKANAGVFPKIAGGFGEHVGAHGVEFLSGVPARRVVVGAKRMNEIQQAKKVGIEQPVLAARDDSEALIGKEAKERGKAVDDIVENAPGKIDMAQAEQGIVQDLNTLKTAYSKDPVPILADQISSLEKALGRLQQDAPKTEEILNPLTGQYVPNPAAAPAQRTVSPKTAWLIMKDLQHSGSANQAPKFAGQLTPASASYAQKQEERLARGAAQDIYTQLNALTEGRFGLANEKASDAYRARDFLSDFFGRDTTGKKGFKSFRNVLENVNETDLNALKNIDDEFKTTLVPTAELVDAYKTYANPGWHAISSGGGTSTTKSVNANALLNMIPLRMARNAAIFSNAILTGPKAQVAAFKTMHFLRNGGLPTGATQSAWNMLDAGEK